MQRDTIDPAVLLHELRRGVLVPERYSTRSLSRRAQPVVLSVLLATTAIVVGVVLGGGSVRDVMLGTVRVLQGPR